MTPSRGRKKKKNRRDVLVHTGPWRQGRPNAFPASTLLEGIFFPAGCLDACSTVTYDIVISHNKAGTKNSSYRRCTRHSDNSAVSQ